MLQRLFARHISEERIEDAVDHGKSREQQDVLRTRSAEILERLARKTAVAHEEEIKARRAAREAADRAAEEAKSIAEQAEQAAEEASALVPYSESGSVPGNPDAAAADAPAETGVPAEAVHEAGFGMADPAAEPAAGMDGGYIGENAPASADEASVPDATAMQFPEAAEGFAPDNLPEGPGQSARSIPDIHDDPEALEQIRLKAEEAKARIAARLQQIEAGEGAEGDAPESRLDLGEAIPPMSSDDSA